MTCEGQASERASERAGEEPAKEYYAPGLQAPVFLGHGAADIFRDLFVDVSQAAGDLFALGHGEAQALRLADVVVGVLERVFLGETGAAACSEVHFSVRTCPRMTTFTWSRGTALYARNTQSLGGKTMLEFHADWTKRSRALK